MWTGVAGCVIIPNVIRKPKLQEVTGIIMKKRMFMALAVALTGVSMVVAAENGELKIQSEASVRKVHAAEIHQIGVEPIPATGQITIEDLLAVQGGETEDPRAVEGMSDPEDVPVDEASVEDTNADEYAS